MGRDRARRMLFRCLLVVLVAASLELLSFLSYRLIVGEFFSYRAVDQARASAHRVDGEPVIETEAPETPRRPHEFLREDVLHPYLGFVGNPELYDGFAPWGFWGGLGRDIPKRSLERVLIGVFGGSLAADFSDLGAARLAERLADDPIFGGREIVVLNAAHGGFKQPQQVLALTYLLSLGVELDAAIVLDGFNEVALDASGNARQDVFPAYPRGWALRVENFKDRALVERIGELTVRRRQRARLAERFDAAPWRWSTSAGLVWTLLDRRSRAEIEVARERVETYRAESAESARDFLRGGPPRPASDRAALEMLADVWVRGTAQMWRLCESNGIRAVFLLQPNQYVEGSKPLGAEELRAAYDPEHPYRRGVEQGYPLLRTRGAQLREQGVPFHDLTDLFTGAEETLYIDTCCHLNARGHELLADAAARALREAR